MSTKNLLRAIGAAQLTETISLLAQRDTCSEAGLFLLEIASELGEEEALDEACKIIKQHVCQPSPAVTERFLELLPLYPRTLLPYSAHIISGSQEDVNNTFLVYKELVALDRSLLVPVLASASELPLSGKLHAGVVELALQSLGNVEENEIPSLIRALLKLSGSKSGLFFKRIREYLKDASPELLFLVVEVLDDVSRIDRYVLERIFSDSFTEGRDEKKCLDDLGHPRKASNARNGHRNRFRYRPSPDQISPFDFCLWLFMLSRIRMDRIAEIAISESLIARRLNAMCLRGILATYMSAFERFPTGALRFLRILCSHEKSWDVLEVCLPTFFDSYASIRSDIVKDLLGVCFSGAVPLQSAKYRSSRKHGGAFRIKAASALLELCRSRTQTMLPFAPLILDRVSSFSHMLQTETMLDMFALVFQTLGEKDSRILSNLSSLIRKQALWQWNTACSMARLYVRATTRGCDEQERLVVLRSILENVPMDAQEVFAASLLGLIADSAEHGINPDGFAAILEKIIPSDILHGCRIFRTKSLSKSMPHFTRQALRAYIACTDSSWRDFQVAVPRNVFKLYEASIFAAYDQEPTGPSENFSSVLTELATDICSMQTVEVSKAVECAIHGREILLGAMEHCRRPVPPELAWVFAHALDQLERAIAVGIFIFLERAPDSRNAMTRIEALYRSISEETNVPLLVQRIIKSDLLHSTGQIFCLLDELETGITEDLGGLKHFADLWNPAWLSYLCEKTCLCMRETSPLCMALAPALLRLWHLTVWYYIGAGGTEIEQNLVFDVLEYFETLTHGARTVLEAILATNVFETCAKLRIKHWKQTHPSCSFALQLRERCTMLRKYALTRKFDAEPNAKIVRKYLNSPCGGNSRHPFLSERYRVWKWLYSLPESCLPNEVGQLLDVLENWSSPSTHPRFNCVTNASIPWIALCLPRLLIRESHGHLRNQLRSSHFSIEVCRRVFAVVQNARADRQTCRVVFFSELLAVLPVLRSRLDRLNRVQPPQGMELVTVRDAIAFVFAKALNLCETLCEATKMSNSFTEVGSFDNSANKRLMKLSPRILLRTEELRGEIISWCKLYSYDIEGLLHGPTSSTRTNNALELIFGGEDRDSTDIVSDASQTDFLDSEDSFSDDIEASERCDIDSVYDEGSDEDGTQASEQSEQEFYVRGGFGCPALEKDSAHATVSIRFNKSITSRNAL
jgi:hypothetical protein